MNLSRPRIAMAGLLALATAGVQAGVCSPTIPDPCINTYQGAELISSVPSLGPLIGLRYEANLHAVDAALSVVWRDAQGNTLQSGENLIGWFNSHTAWSARWAGVVLPHVPVALFMGQADFRDSIPHPNDCAGGICDAKYYDWQGSSSLRVAAARAGEPPGTVIETFGALETIVPSSTDPGNPAAATYTDQLRFGSRADPVAGGWNYVYTFENLTADSVDYDFAVLGLKGTAAPHANASFERFSALAPALETVAPIVRRDASTFASGRFDALVPVPEPPPAMLLLAGLATVALRRRRRG